MSDDLVAQLRTYFGSPLLPVSHQAANEIERLRAALDECNARSGCQVLNLSEGQLCSVLADIHQISGAALAEKEEK